MLQTDVVYNQMPPSFPQDAVYLSSRNSDLTQENQDLKQQIAQLKDSITKLGGRTPDGMAA